LPPKSAKSANTWLKARRHSRKYTHHIRFTKKPNIRIKINSGIKKQALRCHASQLDNGKAFTGFPSYAVKEILNYEYFVTAGIKN
jgi:LmbE family N-acetylglucosaminyl deacetylase